MRYKKRLPNTLRPIKIVPDYLEFAAGSALITAGKTKVIATATVEEKVPHFLRGSGSGWITAEYSMLPGSTEKRTARERHFGRISGRTQEIQRLIGRSLRTSTDLHALGERTIIVDCDVIQADGGTRSASISAGCVALACVLNSMLENKILEEMPLKHLIGATSVGIVKGELLLDLDYSEDFNADIDMNVVMNDSGQIIEIQATAEKKPFSKKELDKLLALADTGIRKMIQIQKDVLKTKSLLFMAYGTRLEGDET
jgi:ribonuclease PH